MEKVKINILFPVKDGPTGGGNQFLKLLKTKLVENGHYAEIQEADIVIFNSYQFMTEVLRMKRKYPDKIFVHRVDGPIRLYNNMNDKRDFITNLTNKYIADGTVFQSQWSRKKNYDLGIEKAPYECIISNAADERYFNQDGKAPFAKEGKIRIVATSWSNNWKKGFETYKYLDQVLDWNRYEMVFVGNAPIKFDNIKHISPLSSDELSKVLKNSDIYISASENDPCSNSVIEALTCKLPVICLNSGGHPELVKKGGLLFKDKEEIEINLQQIETNYEKFQAAIEVNQSEDIADQYINFCKKICDDVRGHKYITKRISSIHLILLKWKIRIWSN